MQVNRRLLEQNAVPARRLAKASIWSVLGHLTQILAFVTVCIFIYMFYEPTFDKSRELKRELGRKDVEIGEARAEVESLTREIEMLQNNPDHVARVARDRLNLAKPGEHIFRFEPYQPTARSPR